MDGTYKIYRTRGRTVFEIINYTLFTLFCISIIFPFLNVLAISFSDYKAVSSMKVGILPIGFNVAAYKKLAFNLQFLRAIRNSIFLTIVNTTLVIVISLAAGYALSSNKLVGRKIIFTYFLIPMYFGGGMIPSYLLICKLKMVNTYWSLILPGIVSIFYVIVFRNQIAQLPKELIESAQLDGASEPMILIKIIMPLLVPMIMAFVVFSAVDNWNSWFGCMLYIQDQKMWTLQYQLRDILVNASIVDERGQVGLNKSEMIHPENLKMAALMLSILPILVVYPFCQKYFISGVLVGAVKG